MKKVVIYSFLLLAVLIIIVCGKKYIKETPDRFMVVTDSKYGYINNMGLLIIEPKYDDAMPFTEGVACVRIGTKWGYIDQSGEFVLDPVYEVAEPFSEGLAQAEIDNRQVYIDETGKIVFDHSFDFAGSFSEGFAPVAKAGKVGFINRQGQVVIELQFDDLGDFSLDRMMLTVFMELDGQTDLGTVAKKTGLNLSSMREVIAKLLQLNLIEKVEATIRVLDNDFIEYLLAQFSLAVGPIAQVLIEDEVYDLGFELSRVPTHRVAELIDR